MKTEKEKQELREKARRYRNAHPEKKLARKACELTPKKPCVLCKRNGKITLLVEGHHDDYKKPYKLDWLCKFHHEEVDTAKDIAKERGTIMICPVCKEHTLHPDSCKESYYCLRCLIEFNKKDLVEKYKELAQS
jgi:hypothetical protein